MLPLFGSVLDAWQATDDFWTQTAIFLSLTARSLGIALLIGLPAGVLLTRWPRIASPTIATLASLQALPGIALLGLLIGLGVRIGAPVAILTTVIYSLFPIVMNTYVGIMQVPPAVRDAARGMGMTPRQILWSVELPLAFPVILAGVRTGAVFAVGIVTFCALAGARGLGDYVTTGMTRGDNDLTLLGTIPILVLALLFFWGLGGIAWLSKKSSKAGLLLGGGLIVLLSGYAVADPLFQPRRADVRVGAKNFTAGRILAEILRLMLEAHTNLRIELVPNLGSNLAYKSLLAGEIDVYPEYTGNLLTGKEGLDLPVPPDKSIITELVRGGMKRRHHLILLETLGHDDNYVFCVPPDVGQRYQLKTLSDLKRVPELRIVVDLEFMEKPDGWKGLAKLYGLRPREAPRQLTPDLRYQALEQKNAEVICGFGSDWQIDKLKLVTLEDDKSYFPPYQAAPLVREAVLQRHPEVAEVLNRLKGRIDNSVIRRLCYEVTQNKRSEAEVAREFLQEQGLLAAK